MASYTWPPQGGGSGSGTVTSVAVSVPTGFTVSGSPVTTSGTIAIGLSNETANTVWAGPTSGGASAPTFRALVAGDIPTLPYLSTTLGTANGLSVSTNTLSLGLSSTSTTGALSSTDWNTFNGKQASGNYITALTGDATASGPGSVALTLATVNGNVGSFGSSTSIPSFTVNAKGLITAASGNVVIAPAGTLTGTTLNSTVVTSSLTSLGTQSSALNMGSHLINSVTDPVSAQDAATKAYVDNVAAGINPAVAVQAATTSAGNTSALTYNNGVAGIGATLTGANNTALTIDGYTFTALGQRLLVKNDTQSPSGAFNGVYYVTQVQALALPLILTRALDYDTPSDINNTGAIPVINGTVNGTTQWVITSLVNTVGTDPLTFTQFARNPADYLLKANNLSDVTSATTSFNNISPMTTGGDLIYGGASGAGTRLANGSSGQVLTSNGTTLAPSWQTLSSNTGLVAAAHVDPVAADWQGATSATLQAFSSNGSIGNNVLDISNNTWGTPQTSNSNLPQITVNSLVAGTYKVTATFLADGSTSVFMFFALNDGTNTVCSTGGQPGNSTYSTTLVGIFKYVGTANITFSVFGAANSGFAQIGTGGSNVNLMNWIIEKVQ